MYPATIVKHIKKSKDLNITHVIHFDDGVSERVGLPDDGIQLVVGGPPEVRCRCALCVLYDEDGRPLPLK